MLVLYDAKKHTHTHTHIHTHIPPQDPIQTYQLGSNISGFNDHDQMILETLTKVNGLCN